MEEVMNLSTWDQLCVSMVVQKGKGIARKEGGRVFGTYHEG